MILVLVIPFYLVLYGASGHEFDPPAEDILWMTFVMFSLLIVILFFKNKKKTGLKFTFLKILLAVTLAFNAYGGLTAYLHELQFEFGDDISLVIQGLCYLVPLLFILSCVIMLIGLFKEEA